MIVVRYDAVLFDVDGTLIHSSPGILATMEYTFRQMGIDPAGIDLTRYLGPPLRRSFGEHFSDEATVEKMVRIYRDRYEQDGCHRCQVFDGVRPMLERLKAAGVRLYTATSKPTVVVTPILREQGLAGYFDFIGGASEDKSVDTKTAVMRMVLDRPDMQGAADCGVPAVAVMYGYGSEQEVAPFAPVLMAQNCQQLADYILNVE